jgi:2-methylisocitrate lyase-like PEP mutase family enzyme
MKMTAQFRAALAEPDPEPFIFPTVFDALSAQVVAQMGFKACCMGSSTTSNTLLGKPDCRYLTLTEMEFMV